MAKKLSKVQHAGNAFAGLMGRKLIREGPKYGIKPIPESVLKPVVRTTLATIVVLFGTDALKGNDGQAFVADLLTFLIVQPLMLHAMWPKILLRPAWRVNAKSRWPMRSEWQSRSR